MLSPSYVAVIELVPTGKAVVTSVATSPETSPPPIRVEPSKKATEPVGAAEPVLDGVIVAVSVTEPPKGADLAEEVRAVVVGIVVVGMLVVASSMPLPPTAKAVPLLSVATPVNPAVPVAETTLKLVPFHCSTRSPSPTT